MIVDLSQHKQASKLQSLVAQKLTCILVTIHFILRFTDLPVFFPEKEVIQNRVWTTSKVAITDWTKYKLNKITVL